MEEVRRLGEVGMLAWIYDERADHHQLSSVRGLGGTHFS